MRLFASKDLFITQKTLYAKEDTSKERIVERPILLQLGLAVGALREPDNAVSSGLIHSMLVSIIWSNY